MRAGLVFVVIASLGTGCGDDSVVHGNEPGTAEWSRRLEIEGFDLAVDPEGSIYVVGTKVDGGEPSLWLGKFDPAGTLLWTFEDAGTDGVTVAATADAVHVAGYRFYEPGAGQRVYRLDPGGTVQWTVEQPTISTWGLTAAPDGGVYAAGDRTGSGGLVFQRLSAGGEVVWSEDTTLERSGPGGLTTSTSGELLVTNSGDSWWVHAREADGTVGWTREIATPLRTAGFHSLAVGADGTIVAIAMVQTAEVRAYATWLTPDGEALETQPLADPGLEHRVDGDDLLIASFAMLERRTRDGEVVWTVPGPRECMRSYNLALTPNNSVAALRSCSPESELVVLAR